MSVKQFAAQFRATIEDIKAKGTAAIFCDNIINYLRSVENATEVEPSPASIEQYKATLQQWIETNKQQHVQQVEMFKSIIEAGGSAIKSSFLLNGGAAVAMLAFIGHLADVRADKVPEFTPCLLWFTVGVLAVAVNSGMRYLSQWLYGSSRQWAIKVGFVLNIGCILLGLASYGLFTYGMYVTYQTFVAFK
jgi:hypothetical protein